MIMTRPWSCRVPGSPPWSPVPLLAQGWARQSQEQILPHTRGALTWPCPGSHTGGMNAAYLARKKANQRARHKARMAADPEYAARQKALARQHQIRARLRRKYGISLSERDALLVKQGGLCACCGRAITFPGGNPSGQAGRDRAVVDHCHKTKKIRGILCNGCNTGLGGFEDSPERLRGAIAYLSRLDTGAPST